MKSLLKSLTLAAIAVSAVATASADVRSTSVNIGDLDLSTRADALTLSGRLEAAAEDVCTRSTDTSARRIRDRVRVRGEIEACIDAALEQAAAQLDALNKPTVIGLLATASNQG